MAISLGGLKMKGEQQKASRQIAKEYERQQAKESKRKGWSSFLGGVGGKLLGTALAGMTGGLAAPLLMAAGTFGGKALAHQATKGMGADLSKIKAGKYGFGKEEVKTLREGLEEQLEASDPMKQHGGFGRDLLSAYASAGIAGKLGGAKDFLRGGEGAPTWTEALVGKDGWKGAAGFKEALLGKAAEDVYSPMHDPSLVENVLGGKDYVGFPFEQNPQLGPELGPEFGPQPFADELDEEGYSKVGDWAQGGLVSQNTTPTIADYFGMQGVSLGGSNKQSLSQMLGR